MVNTPSPEFICDSTFTNFYAFWLICDITFTNLYALRAFAQGQWRRFLVCSSASAAFDERAQRVTVWAFASTQRWATAHDRHVRFSWACPRLARRNAGGLVTSQPSPSPARRSFLMHLRR